MVLVHRALSEVPHAEQMRAMYGTAGREDIDSFRYDPPRRDLQSSGSSQGSSSQSNQRAVWQSRYGQGIPAFPGSRIIPARAIDATDYSIRYGEGAEAH